MIAILEFLFFVLFLPFMVIGVILGMVASTIASVFHLPTFFLSAWAFIVGSWLMGHRANSHDQVFIGLIEHVAQSHIASVPTPVGLLALSTIFFVVSIALRQKQTLSGK